MKNTIASICVFMATVCCIESNAKNSAVTTSTGPEPTVGVSIGTVDVERVGAMDEPGFDQWVPVYRAQLSDGTYMGFMVSGYEAYFMCFNSQREAVTIPDSIRYNGIKYPVSYIGGNTDSRLSNQTVRKITIPETVKIIFNNIQINQCVDGLYMLGKSPSPYYIIYNPVYVLNKEHYAGYLYIPTIDCMFKNVYPYGWDIDWVTVNVEKPGEFADVYLTENNNDWGAAMYVKVTGELNDTDLSRMKELTNLLKLDLSDTKISILPQGFMSKTFGESLLQEICIPSTLKSIYPYSFNYCGRLQSIIHSGTQSSVTNIGAYAFYGCLCLQNIDLSNVTALEDYSFYDCIHLTDITLGNNLTSIGQQVFHDCAIDTVVFPEGLTKIGYRAFQECHNLKSVELPSSLTYINEETFSHCNNLNEVKLKDGLNRIGYKAFYGCTALEEITLPASVLTIDYWAFNNTAIKKFKCYAVTPPTATDAFIGSEMDMSATYLYVPPFSKDQYRNTTYWNAFNLMRSIDEPFDNIVINRPLTINLEEEDNAAVANKPTVVLQQKGHDDWTGQLTAKGNGILSAGQFTVTGILANRNGNNSYNSTNQYCPTLINYAEKMRADNVSHNIAFYSANNKKGAGEWHFLSLPYDVKVSDIEPKEHTYWVIRRYDSAARAAGNLSQTWVNLTNDDILEAGKGYIISAATGENGSGYPELTFNSGNSLTKNNMFRHTDVTIPLKEYESEFAHNRSWNFIGNPYPAYFDLHHLNEDFTAPITVWNDRTYVAYSPIDDDLVLSPYEAFFVQCPVNTTEMTFKETGRLHSAQGKSKYKVRSDEHITTLTREVFNFVLTGTDYEDRTRIVLNEEATAEYEIGRDAAKFFADNNDYAQIYVNDVVAYSINERPVADGTATIGLRSSNNHAYTLTLNGKYSTDWHVMLTDNMTGKSVDLTEEAYSFIAGSSENANRFSIKFTHGHSGIDDIINNFGNDTDVTVTAIDGTVVYTGAPGGFKVSTPGIYLISNGVETRKVIFN